MLSTKRHVKYFLKRREAIILSGTLVKASLSGGHVMRRCAILNKEEKALGRPSRDYKRRPWPQSNTHGKTLRVRAPELRRASQEHSFRSSSTTPSLVR